jgi:hypothetical protein
MSFLQTLFKPSKKNFMKQYVSILAHLSPYGMIEKDFKNLTVTLVTDKGRSCIELNSFYTGWLESDERESYILGKVSDQMIV